MYPINEYFHSMQGEGYFTGMPSFFIRFQGCDVGCKFCDTKYTWSLKAKKIAHENLQPETPSYAEMTSEQLLEVSRNAPHVVITGGEPCQYNLFELTNLLIYSQKTVQIETSGTEKIQANSITWVTLSPKFNNPGKKPILSQAIDLANEFKFPVGSLADIEEIDKFFEIHDRKNRMVWLQPISMGKEATDLCLSIANSRRWRVSIQTHKYIGLR